MVRLQARAEAAGKANSGAEAGDDADLAGRGDQVLDAHELADGGSHLRREAGGESSDAGGRGRVREQPVAQLADGQGANGREGLGVVGVDDETGDFVAFIGHNLLGQEVRQWQVGQCELRGDALLGGLSRQSGQHIAAAQGRGLGQQVAQVPEGMARVSDGVGEGHAR